MEKRMWTHPLTSVEQFAANEYVAACGDLSKTVYYFQCDAPAGTLYYYDNNHNAQYVGSTYHPCNKTHEVTVNAGEDSPFYEGFVDRGRKNGVEDEGEHAAIWIEWNWWGGISNAHAMNTVSVDNIYSDKS